MADMRLIDANAYAFPGDLINEPTIDAVPVVRCKECKYIRPEVYAETHNVAGYWCSLHDIVDIDTDGFCNCGERKADGNQ